MERSKIRSTKKKFVADGVFRAEVNELLENSLADFGFSGIEINITKSATEVRVLVSKFNDLMDPSKQSGIKIKELKVRVEIEPSIDIRNSWDSKLRFIPSRRFIKFCLTAGKFWTWKR